MNDGVRNELLKVTLAGLLHDVGKFMQRAEVPLSAQSKGMETTICKQYKGRYSHRHVLWTNEFFNLLESHPIIGYAPDNDSIGNLAAYHHNPSSRLQELVQLADRLSSGCDRTEDDEEHDDREWYKKARLHVIFDYLKLDGFGNDSAMHRYELDPLDNDVENSFPTPLERLNPPEGKKIVNQYGELWNAFREELENLGASNLERFTVSLLSLLEKYTWCQPSSTMDRPDISLFDHAKTTAAIAAALYLYHTDPAHNDLNTAVFSTTDDEPRFKLLVGDLSGIQGYIFNIKNVGVGGTAKRLRSRSFFLSALSDLAAHRILARFGLTITNLIISSGGKFYLLLPNTARSDAIIDGLRQEFDSWCMDALNGEVGVNIATVDFSCAELLAFNQILKNANDRLQERKSKPFNAYLAGDAWHPDLFVLEHRKFSEDEKLCQSCERFPGREGRDGLVICPHCNSDLRLGAELAKAEGIQFFNDERGDYRIFGASFSVLAKGEIPDRNAYLVNRFNDWGLGDADAALRPRYFANHVPIFTEEPCRYCDIGECGDRHDATPGNTKYFNCLAQASRGRKALGVFKADVDNLGLIFINGFRSDRERAISRITTLSRQLESFFTGRVDYLLRSEFPDVYTVYAGGDDLLLIGPWSTVFRFSQRVRDEFRQFTCNNPAFTLSAGIALSKPRLPIYSVIDYAEDLLDEAKNSPALGETSAKNQVALFGDCFPWRKAERLTGEAERLSGWLADGKVSMSFVRQLLESADSYRRYRDPVNGGDTRYLRFIPMLAYAIIRNLSGKEQELISWAHDLTDIHNSENLKNLTFITNYAITANRG